MTKNEIIKECKLTGRNTWTFRNVTEDGWTERGTWAEIRGDEKEADRFYAIAQILRELRLERSMYLRS